MRLIIRHRTIYRFEDPASAVIQTLRLSPRSHEGQHVARWRLDVDCNCRLRSGEDAFGNITHVFAAEGPLESLTVTVEGEVDTLDTSGIVRGAAERFPPPLYLRETDLTSPDPDISEMADEIAAEHGRGSLDALHVLLKAINERMTFDAGPTDTATSAAEAFRLKRGVCQDLTHVFIVGARRMGSPARYVGGYLRPNDDMRSAKAGHSWAEAHVPGIGWIGFDPANGLCATDAHVRVAIGLDYLGAAPVRGARYGGMGETLEVEVSVADALERPVRRRS